MLHGNTVYAIILLDRNTNFHSRISFPDRPLELYEKNSLSFLTVSLYRGQRIYTINILFFRIVHER